MISSLAVLLPIFAATLTRAEDHQIVVGGPGVLAYSPPFLNAAPGDTITFQFHEKNHTVTQSSFASPCSALQGADGSFTGFNSGFMPVAAGTSSGFPTFTITVNDTKPIWAYCQQPGPPAHCQSGMVVAINPPADGPNTFDNFKAAAIALGGGANASTTSSASASWTSPPPPVISTVTQTVTVGNSVYTTTYASWSGASPDPTPAAQPAVHTVVVGGAAGLVYSPPVVTAAVGDTVVFQFQVKNHSATQSSFGNPCTKLETSSNGAMQGFDSGFMPVAANATDFPTFNITVNETSPIWGYCRQQGPPQHCQNGMVFAINPPSSGPNDFTAFQALAEHTSNSTNSSTGSGSGSGSGNSTGSGGSGGNNGNGASRAVSTGLGIAVGTIGVIVTTLL